MTGRQQSTCSPSLKLEGRGGSPSSRYASQLFSDRQSRSGPDLITRGSRPTDRLYLYKSRHISMVLSTPSKPTRVRDSVCVSCSISATVHLDRKRMNLPSLRSSLLSTTSLCPAETHNRPKQMSHMPKKQAIRGRASAARCSTVRVAAYLLPLVSTTVIASTTST